MGVRSVNNTLQQFLDTFVRSGTDASAPEPGPLQATGGIISDYVDGSNIYRSHIFTSTGDFAITNGSGSVDYLIIAGGGGGAYSHPGAGGGGGGAGGVVGSDPNIPVTYRRNSFTASAPSSPYTITVGGGGAAGLFVFPGPVQPDINGTAGTDSSISGTGISTTAKGGGAGGSGIVVIAYPS